MTHTPTNKITIKQAVINVCARMKPGDKMKIYQIYDRVMWELKRHGYEGQPTQESVQRRFRENVGITEVEYDGDDYVKLVPMPPLTEEEKEAKQKTLFG